MSDRDAFRANRDAARVVQGGPCLFCGAEVIASYEYGQEGPQRLICCRLVPMCGAEYTLAGEVEVPPHG